MADSTYAIEITQKIPRLLTVLEPSRAACRDLLQAYLPQESLDNLVSQDANQQLTQLEQSLSQHALSYANAWWWQRWWWQWQMAQIRTLIACERLRLTLSCFQQMPSSPEKTTLLPLIAQYWQEVYQQLNWLSPLKWQLWWNSPQEKPMQKMLSKTEKKLSRYTQKISREKFEKFIARFSVDPNNFDSWDQCRKNLEANAIDAALQGWMHVEAIGWRGQHLSVDEQDVFQKCLVYYGLFHTALRCIQADVQDTKAWQAMTQILVDAFLVLNTTKKHDAADDLRHICYAFVKNVIKLEKTLTETEKEKMPGFLEARVILGDILEDIKLAEAKKEKYGTWQALVGAEADRFLLNPFKEYQERYQQESKKQGLTRLQQQSLSEIQRHLQTYQASLACYLQAEDQERSQQYRGELKKLHETLTASWETYQEASDVLKITQPGIRTLLLIVGFENTEIHGLSISWVDVNTHYKKQALCLHPDKGGNKDAFSALGEAYELLKRLKSNQDQDNPLSENEALEIMEQLEKLEKTYAEQSEQFYQNLDAMRQEDKCGFEKLNALYTQHDAVHTGMLMTLQVLDSIEKEQQETKKEQQETKKEQQETKKEQQETKKEQQETKKEQQETKKEAQQLKEECDQMQKMLDLLSAQMSQVLEKTGIEQRLVQQADTEDHNNNHFTAAPSEQSRTLPPENSSNGTWTPAYWKPQPTSTNDNDTTLDHKKIQENILIQGPPH